MGEESPPLNSLPAGFYDAGDESLIGHLAEAQAGEFEFAQEAAGPSGKLAPIAEPGRRGVFRHLVQVVHCGEPLFNRPRHIEDDCFELRPLFELVRYESFPFFLLCNR